MSRSWLVGVEKFMPQASTDTQNEAERNEESQCIAKDRDVSRLSSTSLNMT